MTTVSSFLDGCRKHGVDPDCILENVGMAADSLSDPQARFSISKLGDLIVTITRALQDESLGFFSRPVPVGGIALAIHSTITAKTLEEALQRWILFWNFFDDEHDFSLSIHGEEAQIQIIMSQDQSLDYSSFLTWIIFLNVRLASWLIDKPVLIDRMYFQFAEPLDVNDYRDMFPTRHYFDQSANKLVFNKRFLDMPIAQFVDDVADFVEIVPHLMTIRRADNSYTGQIRRMLQGRDNIDALPLKAVAAKLHKSPNTIQRHLKNEGSSYKEIKESVRRDLAIDHLQRGATPINQIATMLGFSEPSAFNRAFKNWTGVTPGDYRRSFA